MTGDPDHLAPTCTFCHQLAVHANPPLCKPHHVTLHARVQHLIRCRTCHSTISITANYINAHPLPNCGRCSSNNWALVTNTKVRMIR